MNGCVKMSWHDKSSRAVLLSFIRNALQAFNPIGVDPETIFLKDLPRISPANLSHLLRRTDQPILFDLRNRHELDSFPFTICDALQVGDLDWEALLNSVPSQNIVILYGANDESVAEMAISSLPTGCEVWTLRGGLSGQPVNDLHHQQACSEEETR
jgi:hypothetical protein